MWTSPTPATPKGLLAAALFVLLQSLSPTLAVGQVTAPETKTQAKTPDPCTSAHDFATTDCALTWHGITVYGA